MNDTHLNPDNGRFDNPGIVAVNARGSANSDLGKKIMFVAAVLGLIVVGSVWGLNKWRAENKAAAAEEAKLGKLETKPAQVGPKRDFDADAKLAAAATPRSESPVAGIDTSTGTGSAECKPVTVLDSSGKPILGNDGQYIRIGCDGKLVPAIDPGAAPHTAATGTPADRANQQAQPRPSRYSGDVLIQGGSDIPGSPKSAAAAQSSPNAMALVQQLLAGQQPSVSEPESSSSGFISTAAAQTLSPAPAAATPNQRGNVGALLTPTLTPKVAAGKIGDRNMLLAKGAQIDCALTTKLISEISGFASCILTSNVYSDNGKVLLLERLSEAQGEYVATMQQGQRRLHVLWTRIKTPHGVVIALDSPAADGLGTMGLGGYVDNRWLDRIGAALMLSLVKDAVAYKIADSSGGTGTNSTAGGLAYQNSARSGEDMAERILSSTINIQPTLYKNQGDRASIFVARDLDFSSVYALRAN